MEATAEYFTESQATDEAFLLFTRKMRRLHPEAFADIWKRIPDGAKYAILASEHRADALRDESTEYTWAPEPDLDEA